MVMQVKEKVETDVALGVSLEWRGGGVQFPESQKSFRCTFQRQWKEMTVVCSESWTDLDAVLHKAQLSHIHGQGLWVQHKMSYLTTASLAYRHCWMHHTATTHMATIMFPCTPIAAAYLTGSPPSLHAISYLTMIPTAPTNFIWHSHFLLQEMLSDQCLRQHLTWRRELHPSPGGTGVAVSYVIRNTWV